MKQTSFIFAVIAGIVTMPVLADDCLSYKLNPTVEITTPSWFKEVVQPLKSMEVVDRLHGTVSATLDNDYEIEGDITSIEDGFCISLKAVKAAVGYSDFQVRIDSSHVPNSCTYNAILMHEDEHIRAYLSVIDDYKSNIESAVYSAADSVTPVFVRTQSEIEAALDLLNNSFQNHPELILMNQRIQAEQEIRNKRVDQYETGSHLKHCM